MINVLLSTFNEAKNIYEILGLLLETLQKMNKPFLIVVVDGNSPDGTSKMVKELKNPNIKVVDEKSKSGLGNSYKEGLKHCIYDYTVILDADLQHDPSYIPQMFEQVYKNGFDIAIGTRYSGKGMVCGWSFRRKFISAFANNLGKYIIGVKSTDITGSFRCYRTEVLKKLFSKAICKGFGIQFELIARAEKKNYKIAEVPIVFYDRVAGDSKLQLLEVFQFFKIIILLYFLKLSENK